MTTVTRAALVSLLYGVTLSIAHVVDNAHAHEQCAFTVDGESFNISALKRKDQMWSVLDPEQDQSYYFNLCGDSTQVDSTQCLDVNNTKMAVFGCQITYGRPNAVVLGDEFSVERYTNGVLPNGDHPDFPITNGIHVNISGGTRCHNHGQPERQLDIWIECDLDADTGSPGAPPDGVSIETAYCEYDLFWKSSYACRQCTDDDYTKTLLDPPFAQFDDSLGCRLDGNWTVRYTKKPEAKCAHGVHDGVMTTRDLNEFCDASDCPHGFYEMVIYANFKQCVACDAGHTTEGRGSTSCVPCQDNTFAPNKGSDQCAECGHSTTANAEHTECDFTAGHCAYIASDDRKYDLSRMASDQKMAGPVYENGHQYFLNLCSTGHAEHACFNSTNEPLVSYSCQIPQGSVVAKDLGNTIGLWEFDQAQRSQLPEGGVRVELTGGSVCHHQGAQQQRSTDIFVTCDPSAGVGYPSSPNVSTWNPDGKIEPDGMCKYEFLWPSRYGCPLCSLTGSQATYEQEVMYCDPHTGFSIPTYRRLTQCIGNPKTGLHIGTQTGPETFSDVDTATPCNPTCPAGYFTDDTTGSKICKPCPIGQMSTGGQDAVCTRCQGNTYNYNEGSTDCIECGAGTTVNAFHNGCTGLSECQWRFDDQLYDLKPLDKESSATKSSMFGPITDENSNPTDPSQNFQYYINLCSRQAADGTDCAGDDGVAIESFACQRTTLTSATLGHLKGVNLGDTMGVTMSEPGKLTVNLTHGTQCHRFGQPHRSTQIDLVCDDESASSSPVPYQGTAEVGYCKYRFTWNTIQACPVCTEQHYKQIVSECEQGEDGAWVKTTHIKKIAKCNPATTSAIKMEDTVQECEAPGHTPWYKSAAFLITVIVLSTSVFGAVAVFALVKYWKVRRLYETYAQLDKDRGMDDFNSVPESFELDARKEDSGL